MFTLRNIKDSFRKLIKKIGDFLLSKRSREFLVFLFFFFIASVFWLLRVLSDDYMIDVSIPLQLENVPNYVIVTHDLPDHLTVKVKDKGTVLLGYELGKKFAPAIVDFGDYKTAENQRIQISTENIEKNFLAQFNPSTKIISVKPEQMELFYSDGKCKKIPVSITGNIRPARQYYITDTVVRPYFVNAFAPKEILKTLHYAYTVPVMLKDINNTVYYQTKLRDVKGVKFVPSYIKVVFHTDIYSEKKVEIPIVGVHFPSDKRLLTFPSKAIVTFQVGSYLFKKIKASDFAIEIPYEKLDQYKKDKYPLRLNKQPKGVRNIRISPETVDFLIEQNAHNGH